jgi:hypothetical protein
MGWMRSAKEDDPGAEYARNEWRPGRSPLGFCLSPNPAHEGRFATNQNEVERKLCCPISRPLISHNPDFDPIVGSFVLLLLLLLGKRRKIMCHSGTDKIFQGALIHLVTLVEIDGSPLVALQAGVEDLIRIGKACAVRERQFYLIFVSVGHQDQSAMRPTGRAHPFPFLDYLGIRLMDDFANMSKHFAAPVSKV